MKTLEDELQAIAAKLPAGSEFKFHLEPGKIHLDILRIAKPGRGIGTRFMARILDAIDRHKQVAELEADPTDEPGDPDTFTLVRWYARFGFFLLEISERETIVMMRLPHFPGDRRDVALARYAKAKDQETLSRASFDAWHEDALKLKRQW